MDSEEEELYGSGDHYDEVPLIVSVIIIYNIYSNWFAQTIQKFYNRYSICIQGSKLGSPTWDTDSQQRCTCSYSMTRKNALKCSISHFVTVYILLIINTSGIIDFF